MAAKKANTDPELTVNESVETTGKDPELEKVLAEQQAQIQKLQQELAKAQQRSTGRQDDAAVVRKAAEEAAEAGKNAFDVVVSIRAPKRPGKEDPWYWLNVNGRSVQVPADDRYHELRLPWAETLINMLEAERRAEDFQDGLEVYDPVTNPKKD